MNEQKTFKVPKLLKDLPGAKAGTIADKEGLVFKEQGQSYIWWFGSFPHALKDNLIDRYPDWFEWITPEPEWTLKSAIHEVYVCADAYLKPISERADKFYSAVAFLSAYAEAHS